MFSIICDGLRYTVTCLINNGAVTMVDAIVDTGALYTCYKAEQISDTLTEEQFIDGECRLIGGFVSGRQNQNAVKFYQYFVPQFTIGTIDMGARSVWITFDERISDNVLGMDILKSVAYMQLEDSNELYFFKDRRELFSAVRNLQNEGEK